VFGIGAIRGRTLLDSDATPQGAQAVVIRQSLCGVHFGEAADVLPRTIRLNATALDVRLRAVTLRV
jgi:hypothetical protein